MVPAKSGGNHQDPPHETVASNPRTDIEIRVHEAEDRLHRLLMELRGVLTEKAWSELKAVQGTWEEFKNRDCSWRRQFFEEGSVAPLVHSNCLEEHVVQRINSLKLFLCEGYGMTGPCEASDRY